MSNETRLFRLECELDEDLLQLLVHKVDAELLEPVLLENLKAVDVQDAQGQVAGLLLAALNLHGSVDPLQERDSGKKR